MLEPGMLREERERIAKCDCEVRIKELEDKNKKLAELALDWLRSAEQARGSIFGPRDKVDYDTGRQEIYQLKEK